jgi:peptide/nickel transport system substrate-binding protein
MRVLLGVLLLGAVLAGLGWWVLGLHPGGARVDVALDAQRARPQGDYYVGAYVEPRDFNPFTSLDSVVGFLLGQTHDALLDLDPQTAELRAGLAQVELRSASGLSCVLALREDLLWSDGTPLTTEDVAFTYALARDPAVNPGRLAAAVERLESLEVLDVRRVRLTLRERHFAGLGSVATELRIVQKRWWLDEVARRARAAGEAVPATPGDSGFARFVNQVALPGPASGPFKIAEDPATGGPLWRRGEELIAVQNPLCWRRRAEPAHWNLAGLKLRFIADPAAQQVALRTQKIDWLVVDGDPQEMLDRDPELARRYRALTYDYVRLGQYVVMWNCRRKALADPRVRRALTMLFDRDTLVDKVLTNVAARASGWFKPGSPEYPENLAPIPFDPRAARGLLREAGFDADAGKPLRIGILRGNTALHERIVDLARPAFEQAGVVLDDMVRSYDAYQDLRDRREFDGLLAAVNHSVWIDPFYRFHSSQVDAENFMGWAHAEADRLLVEARAELDGARRAALYRQFGAILHAEQPVTLLCHPRIGLLLHQRFEGVAIGKFGLRLDSLWVPETKRLHE